MIPRARPAAPSSFPGPPTIRILVAASLLLLLSSGASAFSSARAFSPRSIAKAGAGRRRRRPAVVLAAAARPSRTSDVALRSSSSSSPPSPGSSSGENDDDDPSVRGRLRRLTGFSLTAFRATMRATTGFSLTALRATLRAATGISVTGTMKWILGLFPTWFRYFLQPFLILYYAPLMILRAWVGPTKTARAEALAAHERVVEGWKDAIRVAEGAQEGGYWPVHVDDDGNIVAALPPEPDLILGNIPTEKRRPSADDADIVDAVFESVEYAESHKPPDEEKKD